MSIRPELIGKRLKSARMLTGLTRTEFAQKTAISAATLRVWENPVAGSRGITGKGAIRFLQALNGMGIDCSFEWLIHGLGSGPKLNDAFIQNERLSIAKIPPSIDWGEEETVFREIQMFKDANVDSTVVEILDDGMVPFYEIGDHAGGKWKKHEHINKYINKNCIVHTLDDRILVRRITQGAKPNLYTISCINPKATVTEPVLYNIEVLKIAPVIWHRVKE